MNSIDVSVDFSYQGKQYTPSISLDLDLLIAFESEQIFYKLIAQKNDIDTYSYLYEVMEQSKLVYANPQGSAKAFLSEDKFDFATYIEQSGTNKLQQQLLNIAKEEMDIASFDNFASLQKALLRAYTLGMEKKS